jgi:HD-GYP domain-containing protein (c-di-GMP phosphodiesterase class II)
MTELERISKVLSSLVAAMSNCSLYTSEHPAVEEFSARALENMEELFEEGSFTLTLLANTLMYNNIPITDKNPPIAAFIRKMILRCIEKCIINKGLTVDELKSFVASLVSREGKVVSTAHIQVGIIEVRLKDELSQDDNILRLVRIFEDVKKSGEIEIHELENIVSGFILAMQRESSIFQLLGNFRNQSEYTLNHSLNVSVLSMFQAESLGIEGEKLHDIGLAGLLHDVGKLFISKEILEKEDKLTEHDWQTIKLHPIKGALYLSKIPELPKIVPVVAFEHHMKYDGSGYPKYLRTAVRQHLISSLVAIADFYDALRSHRAYRPAVSDKDILPIMKQSAGKYFNVQLVENFITALESSGQA